MQRFLYAFFVVITWLGCSSDPNDSGNNAHRLKFLSECSDDTQCQEGLSCLCGICTQGCEQSVDCEMGGKCILTDGTGRCSQATTLCAITCQSDDDCEIEQRCGDGLCLRNTPQLSWSNDCDGGCQLCGYAFAIASSDDCYCPSCQLSALSPSECAQNRYDFETFCAFSNNDCTYCEQISPAAFTPICWQERCGLRAADTSNENCSTIISTSNIPGVTLALSPNSCQPNSELIIDYQIDFRYSLWDITWQNLTVDEMATSPVTVEFIVSKQSSDDEQQVYCHDCQPPAMANPVDESHYSQRHYLASGEWTGQLRWDLRTGGKTWPTELRQPIEAGNYSITIRITGKRWLRADTYLPFQAQATFTLHYNNL